MSDVLRFNLYISIINREELEMEKIIALDKAETLMVAAGLQCSCLDVHGNGILIGNHYNRADTQQCFNQCRNLGYDNNKLVPECSKKCIGDCQTECTIKFGILPKAVGYGDFSSGCAATCSQECFCERTYNGKLNHRWNYG
jgi:hypothetical protein